jgi:hypothetical protein
MGATDGMTELYDAIRARLVAYGTINTAVGGRIYYESPPEPVVAPYLLLTIDGNTPQRDKDAARIEFQVEVQIINDARTKIAATRAIANQAWNALAGYTIGNATDGFVKLRVPPFPETLPRGTGDADRDVVQIRIVSEGWSYWKGLTAVLT